MPQVFEIESIKILYAFRYNKIGTIKPNKNQVVVTYPPNAFLFLLQPPMKGQGTPDEVK